MKEEIINTLKKLLSFKTYKDNKEEFDKLFNYVKEEYNEFNVKEYIFNNNKCLVLSNTIDTNLDYIFCTHIDVVYADTYDFYEDKDNIYGRGTIDMKGSLAVLLNIIKNIKIDKKFALFITSDEEIDGNCSNELSKIYNAKFVFVPDGGKDFQLVVEEKGQLQIELSVNTKTAHSAQLYNGENAISKLFNVYQKLIEIYPLPKSSNDYVTSINLSKLNGGESNNQVPGFASMILDIRFVSKDSINDILSNIKNIDKDININLLIEGMCFVSDLNNNYVKKFIKSGEKVLNKNIIKAYCEGTSDAIFFSSKGMSTIIMNPIGDNPHCSNEYINKDSLFTLYKIIEDFIKS